MLLISLNRTLTVMLHHFAKYLLNLAKLNTFTKYCVRNKQAKFGVKILMNYTDIVVFVLGHFILFHSV